MNIGIVGLFQSGKSTLFDAFLGRDDESSKQNTGSVNVPDERLDKLSKHYNPKKTTHATVIFEDCAPLDSSVKSERIKLFDRMKIMDAYILTAGAYRCADAGAILEEVKKLRFEMIMSDLDFVTKRLERVERDIRVIAKNRREKEMEKALLERLSPILEEEKFLARVEFDDLEKGLMNNYNLLTMKPLLYVLNVSDDLSETEIGKAEAAISEELEKLGESASIMVLNGALEKEVAAFEEEEAKEFLAEYGLTELGRDRVIQEAYKLLNLITFFTVGEDECRAWNIQKGETALEAAGAIHSDLARGFIRAEVIEWDQLLELGSIPAAKKAGKLRLEGKTYVVSDGEIIHIMFNV